MSNGASFATASPVDCQQSFSSSVSPTPKVSACTTIAPGRDNSSIELSAMKEQGTLRFEVRDWGGGLPPGAEDQIFKPFYRADQRAAGSGLGLAIVQASPKRMEEVPEL
jgi:nitrogen-specific signal transduction histidine kinase